MSLSKKVSQNFLCFLFIYFLGPTLSSGQTVPESTSILLTEYLQTLEKKNILMFSYDSDLIKGVKVKIDSGELKLDQILINLSKQTAFDFEKTPSGNVLVKPKHKGSNIKVCGTVFNEEGKSRIPGILVYDDAQNFAISTDEN